MIYVNLSIFIIIIHHKLPYYYNLKILWYYNYNIVRIKKLLLKHYCGYVKKKFIYIYYIYGIKKNI